MSATLMPALDVRPALPTVEGLRAKLAELVRQRQKHLDDANACNGAVQFCEALIADLEGGNDGR